MSTPRICSGVINAQLLRSSSIVFSRSTCAGEILAGTKDGGVELASEFKDAGTRSSSGKPNKSGDLGTSETSDGASLFAGDEKEMGCPATLAACAWTDGDTPTAPAKTSSHFKFEKREPISILGSHSSARGSPSQSSIQGNLPHPVCRINFIMRHAPAKKFVTSAAGAVFNRIKIRLRDQPRDPFVEFKPGLRKGFAFFGIGAELRPADGTARASRAKIFREQYVLREHSHRTDVMLETIMQRHNRAVGKKRGEQIEVTFAPS